MLASPEIAVVAIPQDERVWVPQAPDVWFRPLMLNTRQGQWCNLLRVRRAGVLSRHLHPNPVHGFVLKGKWFYREHEWVATEGSYVFEPPGEIHTLVVPEDTPEMITFFNIQGSMVYLDDNNKHVGYETSSPRSTCAARITRPAASAATTSTSSCVDGHGRIDHHT
jgi:quercetin dioxygenase-like cupin family protein